LAKRGISITSLDMTVSRVPWLAWRSLQRPRDFCLYSQPQA